MTCSRKLQKRLEVALRASLHTSSSQRQIAKQLGVSRSFLQRWHRRFKQEGSVSDRVGRGRKPALDSADVAHAVQLALAKPLGGSVEVAAQLKAKSGKAVAPSTIRRHLRAAGLVNGYARKVPFLTDKHKAARLGFCTRNSKTRWASVMFSDSKIFLLQPLRCSQGQRVWYWKCARPTSAVMKKSNGLHVYLGVTKWGVTAPVFVTGAGAKVYTYVDPVTGKQQKGCGAREYSDRVLPALISAGDVLFKRSSVWKDRWIFQQDGAPCHTAKLTRGRLHALMPGRVLESWPASSPDLSWTENVWGWCERELRKQSPRPRTQAELQTVLEAIFRRIPVSMLEKYVSGMSGRLSKCLELKGEHIGR